MRPKSWIERSIGAVLTIAVAVAPAQASDTNVAKKQIRHVVVLFQENVSFDHYFGTYPHALNPKEEPAFTPLAGTPKVEGYTVNIPRQSRGLYFVSRSKRLVGSLTRPRLGC